LENDLYPCQKEKELKKGRKKRKKKPPLPSPPHVLDFLLYESGGKIQSEVSTI
jgi:hypothetical protein